MSTDRTEGTTGRTETEPERSESPPESDPNPPVDPERLRRRLRRRTAEIERREVEEGVAALDARGDLTEEQRETVRELGSALVEELTAPPERGLRRAVEAERTGGRERDGERLRAISRLFDVDEA